MVRIIPHARKLPTRGRDISVCGRCYALSRVITKTPPVTFATTVGSHDIRCYLIIINGFGTFKFPARARAYIACNRCVRSMLHVCHIRGHHSSPPPWHPSAQRLARRRSNASKYRTVACTAQSLSIARCALTRADPQKARNAH